MKEGTLTTSFADAIRKHRLAVKDARKSNAKTAEDEAKWSAWGYKGSTLKHYSTSFNSLTGGRLNGLLEDTGSKGNQWILDLMADDTVVTEVVEKLGYKGGLAVSLGFPPRKMRISGEETPKNIGTVNGDLLTYKAWKDIRDWMSSVKATHFDMIISRPVAGFYSLSGNPIAYLRQLRNAWSLLNPNNGKFIFQVRELALRDLQNYRKILEGEGVFMLIDTSEVAPSAMMVRTPDSPTKLPSPRKVGVV